MRSKIGARNYLAYLFLYGLMDGVINSFNLKEHNIIQMKEHVPLHIYNQSLAYE